MRRRDAIRLLSAALSAALSVVLSVVLSGALGLGPVRLAAAEDAAGFVAGTEDVPLMPGLKNDEATLVVFDKPQGRIVEVETRGKVTRAQVEKFYAQSLPELGWASDGKQRWQRDGEGLSLAFKGHDGDLRVAFSLTPR